jgi:hypothetical protein
MALVHAGMSQIVVVLETVRPAYANYASTPTAGGDSVPEDDQPDTKYYSTNL